MVEGQIEEPEDATAGLVAVGFPVAVDQGGGRVRGVDGLGLVSQVVRLVGGGGPGFGVGVQVGHDEVDGGLLLVGIRLLRQRGVQGPLDDGRGPAGAGAEVDVGVARDIAAAEDLLQGAGDDGGGAALGVEDGQARRPGVVEAFLDEGSEVGGEPVGWRVAVILLVLRVV